MVKIIAEAGVNHFGNYSLALKLIDAVKDTGSDFIKFQMIDEKELYSPGKYEYGNYDIEEVRKQRRESHLSTDELNKLFNYAHSIGIPATATPFGFISLKQLIKLNPPFIKIASGDINFYSLIEEAIQTGIKLIISTGMSTLKDVEKTVNFLHSKGCDNFVLMHCISVYPHHESMSQLGYISTLQKEFGCDVGFSDHTLGSTASWCCNCIRSKVDRKTFYAITKIGRDLMQNIH
ncbi:N-acetylneuraminate synthase [Cyanobacterium sp. HL-69]|uniref:N-acetylneuraminate synthase family protein n=1 Tax=Cyanobacterium sp. HL-69 TaxID=2054282 RepID=UPI000CA2C7CC|nr:N-acetylneuraminate synthase [Cyanobacterium sp. HL-69]